jgi:hypothetical protein
LQRSFTDRCNEAQKIFFISFFIARMTDADRIAFAGLEQPS